MSDESDLKALGEFFKERRQERWENFIQNYVPKLEAKNIEFEIEYFSENQINGKTTEFQKLKKY